MHAIRRPPRRLVLALGLLVLACAGVVLWVATQRRAASDWVTWEGAPAGTPAVAAADRQVPRLVTTPARVQVARMTPLCRELIARDGPFRDAATGLPWASCTDRQGRPMVVQFCSYLVTKDGWTPAENTRDAPRCRAEYEEIRRGRYPPE